MKNTKIQREMRNLETLKKIQSKFLNKEILTEEENVLLIKSMRLGFSYVSQPKNFHAR